MPSMENSFKKAYDRKDNPDGSFELRVKGRRTPGGLMLRLLPVTLIILFVGGTLRGIGGDAIAGPGIVICFFFALRWALSGESVVTVRPNEGLQFSGKNLRFADTESIRVVTHSHVNRYNSFVIAWSGGNEIQLTLGIPEAAATALVSEIRNGSGVTWK